MEFTTRFGLRSQTTRLFEDAVCNAQRRRTGLSPSLARCSNRLGRHLTLSHASLDYNSALRQILTLSSSRFTRRY